MSSETPDRARQAGRALDAANFFLADVRDGLGPYLAVYLLTEQHWGEARIGLVMSVATIAGIVAQTPAGALVDATRAKRLVMVIAAIMVTLASLSLPLFPSFLPVAISQGIAQAAAVIFPPAIAAVSLGIFGRAAFTRRIGRNETFNHAGNAVAAALAGVSAYWFGPTIFWARWRSRAFSASSRSPPAPSITTSPAGCTMRVRMRIRTRRQASPCF
ncbi:MFS family permease [Bradyrhizobium centrosematis]|nr:MFS family permease [Bradyrhizobium centrosematis]MCS3773139.1 MFS family permease [Bradyrhizobium centrosematis]